MNVDPAGLKKRSSGARELGLCFAVVGQCHEFGELCGREIVLTSEDEEVVRGPGGEAIVLCLQLNDSGFARSGGGFDPLRCA